MAKRIVWTNEMEKELLNTNDITKFSRKWGMSYNSANNKRIILLKEIEPKNDIQVEKTVLEEQNATIVSIIPSVILNIDSLIEKGTKFYLTDVVNNISNIDKSISDIEHILEYKYNTLSKEELATLSANIGKLRCKRRLYKNEYDFLDKNRFDCESFIKFIKEIRNYSQRICDKTYSTRVLKEELGKVHIVNENNSKLSELKELVEALKNENDMLKSNGSSCDKDYIDKIIKLEKYRIKQVRKNNREKGIEVWADFMQLNWKQLFDNLDKQTKEAFIKDAYDKYRDSNNLQQKDIMDYVVWNDILPNMLFSKGYFLK